MITPNNAIGFSNLMSFQTVPSLRKTLKSGDSIFAYFKYSPIASDGFFAFLGPASREIGGGFGWVHPLKSGTPLSLTFEYSDLAFQIPVEVATASSTPIVTTGAYQSTSYSLNIGIGL